MSRELSIDLASPQQRDRLSRFSAVGCADIHCHCVAGLDDGPEKLEQAIELCRALVADGITTVIATPHQLGAYEGSNSAATIRQSVQSLNDALAESGIPLQVLPGADVRVDERLAQLLADDDVLTLTDAGAYLLLELPHETYLKPGQVLNDLLDRGTRVILSHPERQAQIARSPELLLPWLEQGALLQVTAGSLLGHFGESAQRVAWDLIGAGIVSLIASDAHDITRRPPCMTAAIDQITRKSGHAVARRLCIENPLRIIEGVEIAPPRSLSLKRAGASKRGRWW